MSFNYLEIARAAEIISAELPTAVQGVELVEFPLPGPLPDLNIGLRLANKKMIVFALRSPWTGLFYAPPGAFRPSKQSWARAFDGAQDWNPFLRGQILNKVSTKDGDRVAVLDFHSGAQLKIELFPARPNWIVQIGGQEFRWRPVLPPKKEESEPGGGLRLTETDAGAGTGADSANRQPLAANRPADRPAARQMSPLARVRAARTNRPLVLREFENVDGKDWADRAYRHYLKLRQDALLASQLSRAQTQLQTRISQLIKVRGQMMSALNESRRADEFKQKGEQLKGLIYAHPKTFRADRLENIALDPKLSLADNSLKYFERYKKAQRTKKEVEARMIGIEEASKKLSASTAKLRGFKRADNETFEATYGRLTALLTEAGIAVPSDKPLPEKLKKAEKKWQESGVRKFQSQEGLNIWAGRNHKENEELVIRLARGNDMWMHLKGKPGAHVIIQLSGGKSPSLETLLDGATLVAYYSGVSNNDKVEVDYTFRKYVKRVPGNKDKFLVTYTQNKTLMVKLEETRLWRLLKQHSF